MTNGEKYKTAEERAKAFREWKRNQYGRYCMNNDKCAEQMFMWLDLETPAENPLPCPFCGAETSLMDMQTSDIHFVECENYDCGYKSAFANTESAAIAAHNRIVRAVLKDKEMR